MGAEQHVALVTGAARGLGREAARQLVESGITVMVAARNPEARADGRRGCIRRLVRDGDSR